MRVLAHSDVAPARKQDPGEKFPWRTLVRFRRRPLGRSPAPITEGGRCSRSATAATPSSALQESLGEYGYGIAVNGNYDSATHDVVTAFQRHFRPERVDGVADQSTRTTLQELLAHRGRVRNMAARARACERIVAGLAS